MTEPMTTRVDAFLCDNASDGDDKLHALGIGWNTVTVESFPARHPCIGMINLFRVPYTETNVVHEWYIRIDDADGRPLPFGEADETADEALVVDGQQVRTPSFTFKVGRPAELAPGDDQVVVAPVELSGIELPGPGAYSVVIVLDGEEAARLPFRARLVDESHPTGPRTCIH